MRRQILLKNIKTQYLICKVGNIRTYILSDGRLKVSDSKRRSIFIKIDDIKSVHEACKISQKWLNTHVLR